MLTVVTLPFLRLTQLGDKEVIDGLVGERVRVLEVQAVTGTRNDGRSDVGAGEGLLRLSRNAAAIGSTVEAAATAERNVTLASNDKDWTGEVVRATGLATDGEQLANCHGLASRGGESEDLRVESAGREEVGLHAGGVASSQVAVIVLGSESCVFLHIDEVAAELEERHERAVLGEASEGNAIADVGVHGGQCIGVSAAKGVSDVDNLLELVIDPINAALAKTFSKGAQTVNFEQCLDLLDWVAVRRHANA